VRLEGFERAKRGGVPVQRHLDLAAFRVVAADGEERSFEAALLAGIVGV
jgi:hypothetical protein